MPETRGALVSRCGTPGITEGSPASVKMKLGRLTGLTGADLKVFVYFLKPTILLFFRKLLQGIQHKARDVIGSLFLLREFRAGMSRA